jgi:hypothetical protein
LRAFHQRIAARRGGNIATVAVARKLAMIAWHMLSRGEDYAFAPWGAEIRSAVCETSDLQAESSFRTARPVDELAS